MSNLEYQIAALEQKIQNLDVERVALVEALTRLKQQQAQQNQSQHITGATVNQKS